MVTSLARFAGSGTGRTFRRSLAGLAAILLTSTVSAAAGQLACPAPDPALVNAAEFKGLVGAGTADLANQVYAAVNRMQAANPSISYAAMTDALLGAYCNAVSEDSIPAANQLAVIRNFDRVVQAQLAANMMPNGTVILATVPLAPAVFDSLRKQAAGAGKTPAQLMSEILAAASGR